MSNRNDYALIGSISPKALIRQHGILVDKDNYQALEPKIRDLKKQIGACKDENKKEDLQQQLDQLYKDAKYLIDLSGKILLFLESPHPDVAKQHCHMMHGKLSILMLIQT